MSEWIDIQRWSECARMERPGMVFEVVRMQGEPEQYGREQSQARH